MTLHSRRCGPVICAVCTGAAICFLFIVSAIAHASEITIGGFLITAKNDSRLTAQDEKTDFLQHSSSNTPLLEKIEFRPELSHSDNSTTRTFRLRAYPNGWGKTRADRSEYDTTLALSKLRRDVLFHEALKKRYVLVVEYIHSRSALEANQKLRDVYADVCTVLKKHAGTTGFDLKDLVAAQENYDKQQLAVLELESRLKGSTHEMYRYIPQEDTIAFDAAALPGVDQICAGMTALQQMPDGDTLYVKEQGAHVDIARSRYDQEKAESSKIISFLGASYEDRRKNSEKDSVAVEMGIMLPFINSNRLAENREKLKYLEEKSRRDELKMVLAEKRELLCRELTSLLEQYRVIAGRTEADNEKDSRGNSAQTSGADPLLLLRMREWTVKNRVRGIVLRERIYLHYIELLDVTGRLSEKPLKNYLSTSGEHIDL